jgi:ppGpp synthetase/RelA/SpoT-type nucleotidyltranferase
VNLTDYEQKFFPIYQAFAETVRIILEKALLAAEKLPRPQSIQCRAKAIDRLRRRLVEDGKLDTQTLDLDRRDLAGVRLIFYTNNDVDRFLASSLISDNFEIEEDSTKIHHPMPDNKGTRYRGIHYTARLHQSRLRLSEYARFDNLRCEIQVQTILNHAWSETFHDILYKSNLCDGYGRKAMKAIERRFERIVDEYLVPAGFEIQKAQQEYENLIQGKELFDKDVVSLLDNAQNNNERYQILSDLKDYAIPNYDDRSVAYEGLKTPLLNAVKAARATEVVPIETTYGNMAGFKADTVTRLVLEIVQNLAYSDVLGTLQLLIDIYLHEPNTDIQRQIVNAVESLSEYNIAAYKQVGPMLQMALVDRLAGMNNAELDSIRPIALTVWNEALQSDITGTKWSADSVTLSTGAVPVSHPLSEVRNKAITALFAAYDRSTDDAQKRAVLSALDAATRTPSQAHYSNELLATTLNDATRIVDFVTARAKATSPTLLQHLEHRFFYDYRRAKALSADTENRFSCQREAEALLTAIAKFRNTVNADERFVRYKVLVGFESIFPAHWTDEEFDAKADEYRREEVNRYIDAINAENESDWFAMVELCAETKSDDRATFPVFGTFISKLAEHKPDVAERFLGKASDNLRSFLPGFLNGLALSGRPDIHERMLETELETARSLPGIAQHLQYSDVTKPRFAVRLLKRAIDRDEPIAVTKCLLFAMKNYGTEKIVDADTFLRDALTFLNERKDPHWVSEAWLLREATKFYEELSPERTAQVLQNLGNVTQVNYQVEQVLLRFAERQPAAVWDYFGARLAREVAGVDEGRFEAVPFNFYGLEKVLSRDPHLAISKGLVWFAQDRDRFEFRGGRLLSRVFPKCTEEISAALAELVKAGGDTEADLALAIVQNYDGETSIHVVLKEIVSRFPDDSRKMSEVRASIDNTGMVSGEFGLAEALRARKESLMEWLADERPAVKVFAKKHIAQLELMMASEARRAETRKELRKRSYDEDNEQ